MCHTTDRYLQHPDEEIRNEIPIINFLIIDEKDELWKGFDDVLPTPCKNVNVRERESCFPRNSSSFHGKCELEGGRR